MHVGRRLRVQSVDFVENHEEPNESMRWRTVDLVGNMERTANEGRNLWPEFPEQKRGEKTKQKTKTIEP